jgi:ABC-type uncharacterized transport system permease subunit
LTPFVQPQVQYRANFFIQLFQSALSMGTGLIVLSIVFGYTDSLNGGAAGNRWPCMASSISWAAW